MSSKQQTTVIFEQAVLKAKVAQICDHVGFHAITQDSSNILVDIYQRMIYHLGRHCKDAANNNRRVEPTIIDLIQAYDCVGVSIPSLQEHIETVKLPLDLEIQQDEPRPSNRIQRNLLVDDLLESEKNSHPEDAEDGENKAVSESGIEEDEKSNVPLLKDTYEDLVNKFPACNPVTADKKIRLGGRILIIGANTKLKISAPIPPEPIPSTSGTDNKLGRKRKRREVEKKQKQLSDVAASQVPLVKLAKGKRKKKISREFVISEPSPEKDLEPEVAGARIEAPQVMGIEDLDDEEARLQEDERKRREQDEERQREQEREIEMEKEPGREQEDERVKLPKEKGKDKIKIKGKRGRVKTKEKEKTRGKLSAKEKNKEKEKAKGREKNKGKGRGNKKNITKKPKVIVTPLDPAIAEPPSFFPILEAKVEEPEIVEQPVVEQPDPAPSNPEPVVAPVKQTKAKKRKKSNNQFAIVTESVVKTEEKEYLCPACGGPDDGDVMVECDSCQEWYHLRCISLKKVPEDNENWECDICISKKKVAQKRPRTPVEPIKVKFEVPEPVINTPPPPPQPPTPVVAAAGTSHDDLCPECSLPDDGTLMIQCDDPFCAKWFHGKCVSLLEEPKEDESWFCKVCVDKQQSAFKRRRRAK